MRGEPTEDVHHTTDITAAAHHLNCFRNMFKFMLFFGSMNVI